MAGTSRKTITTAIEDTRHAIVDDEYAAAVIESTDVIKDAIKETIAETTPKAQHNTDVCHAPHCTPFDVKHANDTDSVMPQPGDRLEVYWPLDAAYYPGTITTVDDTGPHVQYDDGDSEKLRLDSKEWRTLPASSASLSSPQLTSSQQQTLNELFTAFGNKSFMLHHAQGFPQPPFISPYETQKAEFCKTFKEIAMADIPVDAKIQRSHVI